MGVFKRQSEAFELTKELRAQGLTVGIDENEDGKWVVQYLAELQQKNTQRRMMKQLLVILLIALISPFSVHQILLKKHTLKKYTTKHNIYWIQCMKSIVSVNVSILMGKDLGMLAILKGRC